MENASKALIIAGAILISILLISVGIIIMNAINDPVQQGASSAESQAVEIFNSQFTGFEGDAVKATTVKALITKVKSITERNVVLNGNIKTGSAVKSGKDYKVEFSYNNGYVSEVNINENP